MSLTPSRVAWSRPKADSATSFALYEIFLGCPVDLEKVSHLCRKLEGRADTPVHISRDTKIFRRVADLSVVSAHA